MPDAHQLRCFLERKRFGSTRSGATINAAAAVREAELSEAELMYRSVQELSMQISRLRSSNAVLRHNCDRLKAELLKVRVST